MIRSALLVLVLLAPACAQEVSQAVSCAQEAALPAPGPGSRSALEFVNRTGETANVYLRNESRHRLLAGIVPPGGRFTQRAVEGQPFVVTDESGACLGVYRTPAKAGLAEVDGAMKPEAAAPSTSIIRTFTGTDYSFPGDGHPATNAPLGFTVSVARDSAGNLYVVDEGNDMVSRIGSDGILHVIAGNGILANGGDGGDARHASLANPYSVAVGPDGSIFVATLGGDIRKISTDGTISTIVNLKLTPPGIGAQGEAIAVDAVGNLYFADNVNNRIQKISPSGTVSTVAGTGQPGFSGDGGAATSAMLNNPLGIRVDSSGNLLIADTRNAKIRKVDPHGNISTVQTTTALMAPYAVDFDAAGNLYVLDGNDGQQVLKIATNGTVTSIAGNGKDGFAGDGGPATKASFNEPSGLAVDASGNVFVSDTYNDRIREISSSGSVSTLAGNGLYRFTADGTPANLAVFKSIYGIALGRGGALYLADRDDGRVRVVQTNGAVSTVAGTGQNLFTDSFGPFPATTTSVYFPTAPAVDAQGNLYFIDSEFLIRRVTPDGTMTGYAGGGQSNPGDNGPATSAELIAPQALAVDSAGNLYISDSGASRIRKVAANGTITTIAGTGTPGFSGDGGPAIQAQISGPLDIAVDSSSNIYFIDSKNANRIRKIDVHGNISTYAGGGSKFADGVLATQTSLGVSVGGLAVDLLGNLYLADYNRSTIRVVSPSGIITTFAGNGTPGFSGDGGPPLAASLNGPAGIATDTAGNVYIADLLNLRVRVVSGSLPSFTLSPAALSFTVQSGGAPPLPQQISLNSSVSGLPYSVTVTTSQNWLTTSATSQVMPATLNITVDPSNLAAGSYQGTITITPGVSGIAPQTIAVTLTVKAGVPSLLAVDTAGLSFSFVRGAAPVTKRVQALDSGGDSVDFTVRATTNLGGNWLSVSPGQGTATAATPVPLAVTADPTGLATGTYTGTVIVADADGGTTILVPVTMTVSKSGELIGLSQTGLTFLAVAGGGTTPPQNVVVLNAGQGAYSFSTRLIMPPGSPNWLAVTPANGTSDSSKPFPSITVSVNASSLSPGDYYGRVEVASTSADNSPQDITVVLRVLPAGINPGALVQPTGLVFTGVAGGGDPSSQTVTISNLSSSSLSFGSSVATLDGGHYITYQPANATVAPGSLNLVVQPAFAGLSAGIYRGAIVLIFSDGSIQTVGILIVLAPSGTVIGSTRGEHATTTGCTAKQLLPIFTSLGANFNVPASFPAAIQMHVVDDCGAPVTSGSVVTSFSNTDPPLSLASLGDGSWSATWLTHNASQNQVTINGAAQQPQKQLSGTIQLSGGLNGNATPPVIGAGGIASNSTNLGQTPLAPGAIISIYGTGLGNGAAAASTLPLSTQLAGAQLVVAGEAMPLFYASNGQVNAMVPYDVPLNAPIQVIATNGSMVSVPAQISLATAQPGIYTMDGSGKGQGDVFVATATTQTPANSTSPAKAGDVIVIYCSGLGPVNASIAAGAPAPASPLASITSPLTLTIGGVQASVFFAGLTPQLTGLYQINAVVPTGITPGNQVPVVITVAGQSSPPVTMAVH